MQEKMHFMLQTVCPFPLGSKKALPQYSGKAFRHNKAGGQKNPADSPYFCILVGLSVPLLKNTFFKS